MNKGKLFILSAPSGAGKTTVLKRVMENIDGLRFSVSHTTRKPRSGETDRVDYHFVDRQEFISMKSQGHFLESASVHNNYYGTSKLAVFEQIDKGNDVILDIDVQGARIVRDIVGEEATYIFLAPPSLAELESRLSGRGSDSQETIATRLTNAKKEMDSISEYEYLIVNDVLNEAVRMFEAIILAERSKSRRLISGKVIQNIGKSR